MWGVAYLCCLPLPRRVLQGSNLVAERLLFLFLGASMTLNLWLNWTPLWLLLGVVEALGGVLSFLGYSRWNVPWTEEMSPEAQISMAVLDLAAAVMLFSKAF